MDINALQYIRYLLIQQGADKTAERIIQTLFVLLFQLQNLGQAFRAGIRKGVKKSSEKLYGGAALAFRRFYQAGNPVCNSCTNLFGAVTGKLRQDEADLLLPVLVQQTLHKLLHPADSFRACRQMKQPVHCPADILGQTLTPHSGYIGQGFGPQTLEPAFQHIEQLAAGFLIGNRSFELIQ